MAGLANVDPDSALGSRAPGLPPIDLPEGPPSAPAKPGPLKVTITRQDRVRLAANADGDWTAGVPDFKPGAAAPTKASPAKAPAAAADAGMDGAWTTGLPDHSPGVEQAVKHAYEMGRLEALGQGIGEGASFGAGPALAGVAAAGDGAQPLGGEGQPPPDMNTIAGRASGAAALRPWVGGWNLFKENVLDPALGINPAGLSSLVTGDRAGPATKAYRKARDEAQALREQAWEQHPGYTFAGGAIGSLAVPVPGSSILAQGTSLGGRVGRGAAVGALGGGLYGAGTAISRGEDLPDALVDAGENALFGAGIGGVFHGALGPRGTPRVATGEAAAKTARDLGAPLPRGVTSDSTHVQSLTSRLRQMPFAGGEIGERVQATQAAAGRRIEEIASGASRTPPDRALAGSVLRPAIQGLIDKNNQDIDAAYNHLRSIIDSHKFAPIQNTKNALHAPKGILAKRRGARMANPEAGLTDVINMVKAGVSFDGLQRARNHLGQVIEFAKSKPNPGFDLADLRRLYAAMSADMAAAVRKWAKVHPDRASSTLAGANRLAETIIEQNGTLQRVLNINADERVAGALITAAQQKTGNLRLLAELKAGLPPDDFEMIAGSLLTELGHHAATGEFSLNKFVTEWDKINQNAKNILFSPAHLQNIEDIVAMGRHIKGALAESSSSHSANLLVLLDLAKDAALLGGDLATSGHLGVGTLVGGGTSVGLWFLTHWLASPAKASSMARWARARQAGYDYGWTPARLATFNLATRNLANTLGISVDDVLQRNAGFETRHPPAALPAPAMPALPAPGARVPASR